MYLQGTNIGTNVYFLKGKRPIDSFCIFISESVVTFTLLYFCYITLYMLSGLTYSILYCVNYWPKRQQSAFNFQ